MFFTTENAGALKWLRINLETKGRLFVAIDIYAYKTLQSRIVSTARRKLELTYSLSSARLEKCLLLILMLFCNCRWKYIQNETPLLIV